MVSIIVSRAIVIDDSSKVGTIRGDFESNRRGGHGPKPGERAPETN